VLQTHVQKLFEIGWDEEILCICTFCDVNFNYGLMQVTD